MVHQCQCLAFCLEASDNFVAIHTRLDDFEGHFAFDRSLLFGDVDDAKTTFTDLFH